VIPLTVYHSTDAAYHSLTKIQFTHRKVLFVYKLGRFITNQQSDSQPLYTVSQKSGPFSLEHNFRKCCPILIIILSLL